MDKTLAASALINASQILNSNDVQQTSEWEITPDDDERYGADFMELVGGHVKFSSLMRCLAIYTHSEFRMDAFRELWTDKEAAERVLECLKTSSYMFESFVRSYPSEKYQYGKMQLCNAWAIEKFKAEVDEGKKNKKIDLIELL
jgi:hypothetical protein